MFNHNTVVLNWNANGLKNNRNTLSAFLNHHNIDIACISETHLSITDKIKFPGYIIYRADRVTQIRAMGGVALLVRNKIIQQQMPITGLECLEAVAVLININNKPIMVVSAYQPPSRRMLIADYDKILSLHNSIIVAGDLNSKHTNWGCRVNNPNGVKLQNFIANTPYSIAAPNEPTYFPTDINRLPDILDILLLKSIPFVCMQETLAELNSDHAPVKITLNSTSQSYQYNTSLIKGKPNWDIYSNQIKTNLKIPNSIPSIQAAEQISEHLITVITEAAQACFKPTHNNSQNISFIPHFILSLIRQKHVARRNWQIQRNPATKKLLNQLTKKVKIALQNHRVSSYNNYLSNMHPGDTNLWKASKRLLNQDINTIPPLRKDNQLVTSDAKKCNVFSEMLFNTFSVNQISNTNNDRRVLNFLDLPDYSVQKPMVHVTPNEIKLIIKKLPNKKAPETIASRTSCSRSYPL
uniref:Putative RNA-directed DNA polymerase n=1 Tax=Sipha flava TaxID=143950 RepID=A0A2S2PXP8_9HEMI